MTQSKEQSPLDAEAAQSLHFDLDKLCRTTGWHNNCGLNCLTHFLLFKLESGELETIFGESDEYDALLKSFQEYYHLPEQPTWEKLFALFQIYTVPTDREAIFAPVLRKHLGKMLVEDKENQWIAAQEAISTFLTTGETEDVAQTIYQSNQEWIDSLKERYDEASTQLDVFLEEAHGIWLSEGAKRYGEYVADLANNEMVTADQLQLLSERLGIGMQIYSLDSINIALKDEAQMARTHGAQNLPNPGYVWLMRVLNRGEHWEFEHPNEAHEQTQAWIAYHNQHYPLEYHAEQFLATDLLSGKFKIHGTQGYGKEKTFINHVRDYFELPPLQDSYACRRSPVQQTAQKAMESLIDKLQAYFEAGQITEEEQALIFETHFDVFSHQLKKKSAEDLRVVGLVNVMAEKIIEADLAALQNGDHLLLAEAPIVSVPPAKRAKKQ